jgi:putative ABC transport system substrate-binding protein
MKRLAVAFLALATLAAPLAAEAQPATKVYRIGYLASATATGRPIEALRGKSPGARVGRGPEHRYRLSAAGWFDRLPDLAVELLRPKVDVIVAGPTPAAVAAKNATRTIPIVIFGVGDPVGLGLVTSLARPGGNVTGLSFSVGMDTFDKGLELLKEALPKVHSVAILSNPANPAHPLAVSNVKAAAGSLGVQLQLLETGEPHQFDGALRWGYDPFRHRRHRPTGWRINTCPGASKFG